MTVTPEPQTQQEPLWRRLSTAAYGEGVIIRRFDRDFDFLRQHLFPILNRNGATIHVGWYDSGGCSVSIYEPPTAGEYGIYEYHPDGDVAACVTRALERYWGLG